ncbi:hypothetical protein [Haloechinothrix sp. LS1_15]|uniref:hypothetical protein n=1 Tax=Haloechinothrix sp. LS1_15 TaxID=2652248 RepID=UPI0029440A20|nr:hypothetical protein [Haloechinothrix sp. LS1_15]MDV6012905.1 hypothetical protein [Haloechinothrix sp. LS1_15]
MTDGNDRPHPGPGPDHERGEGGMSPMPPDRGAGGGSQWPDLSTFRPGVIPLCPLRLGEIFGGALRTLRAYPLVLFGVSFLAVGLSQLLALALTWSRVQDAEAITANADELSPEQAQALLAEAMTVIGITLGLAMLAQLFVTGIATIVASKAVLGQPVTLATAWIELKPRLLPLIGLTILVGALVFAGAMLLLIPGIWAYVVLALAAPALVLERAPVVRAMRRSWDLVLHSWWRIFGILVLAGLIAFGISVVVSMPFEIIGGGADAGTTAGEQAVMSTLGAVLAGTIAYPFIATVHALIYIDRRIRTEGLAVELARAAGMAPPDAGPPGTPHSW